MLVNNENILLGEHVYEIGYSMCLRRDTICMNMCSKKGIMCDVFKEWYSMCR